MIGIVFQQLRARLARSIALLVGVAVATTGFIVLTSTASTSRLDAVSLVEANSRAAYDILVRPRGAKSEAEAQRSSVRPNHLSGQYGGISTDQWARIRAIPGIEVAAPIAMLGYAAAVAAVEVDLTEALDPSAARQIIRLHSTWVGDSGLSVAPEQSQSFVYVTRRPVAVPEVLGVQGTGDQPSYLAPDGTRFLFEELWKLGCSYRQIPFLYLEQQENGAWEPICGTWQLISKDAEWFKDHPNETGWSELNQARFYVLRALPDGQFTNFTPTEGHNRSDQQSGPPPEPEVLASARIRLDWPLWLPMAAIDPDQEDRLVGLNAAVTSGRSLRGQHNEQCDTTSVPVLVPESSPVAEELRVSTGLISGPAVGVASIDPSELLQSLSSAKAQKTREQLFTAADVYKSVLADPSASVRLDVTLQAAAPTYAFGAGGTLHPQLAAVPPDAWRTPVSRYGERASGVTALQPYLANDHGYRAITPSAIRPPQDATQPSTAKRIGTFDPGRLLEFSTLAAVPLETYRSTGPVGADQRSKAFLNGAELLPSNNPASYVAAPPSLLMSLQSASCLVERSDPISAIRVRVANVSSGIDPASRERVRLVAEAIAMQTGLDVDITLGTSPEMQSISIPAGRFGRPELALHEGWSKQGVAETIVQAADKKSVTLFLLILIVCILFLGTATSAAVRDRYRELALLACIGWPAWRRGALILTEVGLVGLAAGLLSAVVALPLAHTQGVDVHWTHTLWAIPVAVGVTLLAAVVPALRASRAHPWAALHAPTVNAGRARLKVGHWSLALVNLMRAPGRAVTAAISLAIGVAAILLLLALILVFDGTVVGTLLGDAVSLQVRSSDLVAVAAIVLLAVGAVTDVLYLNVRERASEFATLWAVGWTLADLNRMLLREAACIGLVGAGVGTASGMIGIILLTGDISYLLAIAASASVIVALVLVALASSMPMLIMRRIPMTSLLAGE